MSILDLTRKVLPKVSAKASSMRAENMAALKNMPEMRLTDAIAAGDKSIVHVGMNESAAVRILPDKTNTIFTDALAGCNSVAVISKGLDGYPIAMLSHYTPLPVSVENQIQALQKQLQTYDYYIDKSVKPKVFFNIRGYSKPETPEQLVYGPNPILSGVRKLLGKFFPKGVEERVIPYQNHDRPAYFSSANIYQFDTANPNKLKVTTVGEKEHFFDLKY